MAAHTCKVSYTHQYPVKFYESKIYYLLFPSSLGKRHGIYPKSKPIDPELQQLKAKLAAAKHDTDKIIAYREIGLYFRDSTKYADSALAYGLKAGQLAKVHPNYSQTPRVWNTIALSYKKNYELTDNTLLKRNYFELAEKYFKKCMYEAEQMGNHNQMLTAWFYLIDLYRQSSNRYNYFKNSFELINYMQKKAHWNDFDSTVLRKTYKSLCIMIDYDISSKKHNEYLSNYEKFTSKEDIIEYEKFYSLRFEQQALTWQKKDEKRLLEEYQTLKNKIEIKYLIEELEESLAQYYFRIQNYEKSFQLMANYFPQNNDSLNRKLGIFRNYFLAPHGIKYMLMGQNAYMLNRNQEAIVYLNKALQYINPIVNSVGLENEKYTVLLYLGKAYKKAGKYREALASNEQADILYKQLYDVGIQALMAENDVHLEEIKQEKKLNEARTQTLLKEQEIEIQKKQKYTFIIISFLALLSAAWAVYSFIKTRKQNQIISLQAAALEESNHLKDKIFALLSHDLRSPINRLVVSLNQSIESQRSAIQLELKSVQDILNNVLYWATMQLKKATPVYANIPLQALADELIDEYYYALEDKNLTFLNNIDSEVRIKTDEGYLKIVLRNLISNAIKFTPTNGYIQIACQITPQNVEILLKDTGVGIAAQKIESLFQLPAPTVGTKQEKGTGLGLSLSADIVKKLGGTIQLKSQEGKGTQVVVALPWVA